MPRIPGTTNARQGKKQVVAYLIPEQAQAARLMARTKDQTLQEVVGDALNAVFERHNLKGPIVSGRTRVIRRSNKPSMAKKEGIAPPCRTGRMSIGGWFPMKEVDEVALFSRRLGVSIQTFVEAGLYLLTEVHPGSHEFEKALDPASVPREHKPMRGRPPIMSYEREGSHDAVAEAINSAKEKMEARAT